MELKYSSKERIAGVFVIGSVLLLVISLIVIGRGKDWFKKYVPYYTTFDESYNVQKDSAVKLLEATIGKVKKISLLEDRVKVELLILEEYASRIRTGAVATIGSPTLIGSEYISIKPGRNRDAPLISEGGLIPSVPRRSLSSLLEEFEVEKTAKMVVKAAQDFSELLHALRNPEGPLFRSLNDLSTTIGHVEKIAGELQTGKGTAGSLLKSDQLINTLQENLNKMDAILDHIDVAAAKTPAAMDRVQDNLATVQRVGEGLVENIVQLKAILSEVKANLDGFKVILNNIEKASFDIPEVSRSSIEGIKEIREGVENIDKVVKSLQQNFLIRSNLPPEPVGKNTDAGLRP